MSTVSGHFRQQRLPTPFDQRNNSLWDSADSIAPIGQFIGLVLNCYIVGDGMVMTRVRAWLMVLVGAIATLVVSCSSGDSASAAAKAAAQAANLQIYTPAVVELRDRFPEVESAFADRKWRDIQTFVHGPLGELRERMARVSRNLPKDQQGTAADATSDLFDSLLAMDEAAGRFDYRSAEKEYQKAITAFDAFLDLIPQS